MKIRVARTEGRNVMAGTSGAWNVYVDGVDVGYFEGELGDRNDWRMSSLGHMEQVVQGYTATPDSDDIDHRHFAVSEYGTARAAMKAAKDWLVSTAGKTA